MSGLSNVEHELRRLADDVTLLTERVRKLEQKSHAPQPVVLADEFDHFKEVVDRRFSDLEP